MPPRVPMQEPPRIERRSQSAPAITSSGSSVHFRPVNPRDEERSPSGHAPTPTDRIRPISSPQSRSLSNSTRSSGEAHAASRSASPKLSDAFTEEGIRHHLGNYNEMRLPKKGKTISETKGNHASKEAQNTLTERQKDRNPPKVNTKIYLNPSREKQVAADYTRIVKSGATEGTIRTRGRLAEAGKMMGNPKKSSIEMHFKQNTDPLAGTLGRYQDPRMHHLERAQRIPSIRRNHDSSSSESDEAVSFGPLNHSSTGPFQPLPKKRK